VFHRHLILGKYITSYSKVCWQPNVDELSVGHNNKEYGGLEGDMTQVPGVNAGILCNEFGALLEHVLRKVTDNHVLELACGIQNPHSNSESGELHF